MDIKQLIEKMDQFAGEKVGQKPGDQWQGTDKGTPGKKLVGDSIIKDLSKGLTPKTREQELAEEWATFSEENIGTHPKRPGRKSDRHSRGHEPLPRYKTIKADEGAMNEKDIELQDYRSMSHKEFQTAYGMTKTEWINKNKSLVITNPNIKKGLGLDEAGNPAQQAAIAMAMKKAGKKPKNEDRESGPEEYEEPYDDADDAYDRQRQEKIDTEAEKEWAKLPKVSTYKLVGRGPNMEPNHVFGDEFDTLEQALEYRAEIMKDPKTPHPEHIGIRTLTRVKEQTNEAIDSDIVQAMGQDSFNRAGYNPLRDERDYLDTLSKLRNLALKPGLDQAMKDHIAQRINDLNAEARKKGFIQAESRGHTIVANKLKDVERAKKFASGELKVPTPQERQAQLKQLEKAKSVKEFVAPPQGTATQTMQQKTQAQDPKQVQAVAQATNTLKAATGSTAPATNIIKAIDSASQGNAVGQQDMKALEPLMKDVATIAQTPQLAGQLKTVLGQVQQVQQKQKQQQTT